MIKMFQRQPPRSWVEEPYCTSKGFTRKQHAKKNPFSYINTSHEKQHEEKDKT